MAKKPANLVGTGVLGAAVLLLLGVVAFRSQMQVFDLMRSSAGMLTRAFLIFALVLPLELIFGTEHRPPWSERLGNIGAMLIHFVLGTAGVYVLYVEFGVGDFLGAPDQPRLALLENPWLYAVAYVAIVDLFYYAYHRLQHAVPLLWRIHKLHHTDPAMNVTTAKRTHFLETPLQTLVLVIPGGWILGNNPTGLSYALIALTFFLYFGHVDINLRLGVLTPALVAPQYHRVHHKRVIVGHGSNFAQVLPLWDLLGGTYERPAGSEFVDTGVEGCITARDRWKPILW